jgi:hypothetical protein
MASTENPAEYGLRAAFGEVDDGQAEGAKA